MANPLINDGPVPFFAHGAIEYLAGIAFIVAPLLLDYDSGAAVAVSIVVGVVVLLVAATTEGPTSLVNALSVSVHVVLDYVLALFLIATPFLFGFAGETPPTAVFIALGVVHLLLTIGTRFVQVPTEQGAPETR
ncbi:MAG: SPW repeat domain-containing protein [Actinomycetota bacterium]